MKKVIKKSNKTAKNKKINTSNVQKLIKEEAEVIKRKKEIYEQINNNIISIDSKQPDLSKNNLGSEGLKYISNWNTSKMKKLIFI